MMRTAESTSRAFLFWREERQGRLTHLCREEGQNEDRDDDGAGSEPRHGRELEWYRYMYVCMHVGGNARMVDRQIGGGHKYLDVRVQHHVSLERQKAVHALAEGERNAEERIDDAVVEGDARGGCVGGGDEGQQQCDSDYEVPFQADAPQKGPTDDPEDGRRHRHAAERQHGLPDREAVQAGGRRHLRGQRDGEHQKDARADPHGPVVARARWLVHAGGVFSAGVGRFGLRAGPWVFVRVAGGGIQGPEKPHAARALRVVWRVERERRM